MKRITAILLMLAVLLLSSGCRSTVSNIDNTTEDSGLPGVSNDTGASDTLTDPPLLAETLYAISVPVQTTPTFNSEGILLFEYSEQSMYLTVPDNAVADKIIIDFLNRIDTSRSDAAAVHIQAEADYAGQKDWLPYAYQVLYGPTRIDQGVLSLFGERIQFSGGSHSERTYISASYDMVTGDVLTLGSILYHLDTKDDLCRLVIDKLDGLAQTTYLYDYYAETVEDLFNQDESHMENFYFSTEGLCFYFAPYEIAPYASGLITVTIPYKELTGIIGDQFFLAERQAANGNIEAHLFSEADLNQFQQFAEITTDAGGETIILATDGIIHDIRIHTGSWDADGVSFHAETTVFAANVLTPTDAIRLETYIPDVMPNQLLTFESGGQQYGYYIFQSGEDGSIILEPTDLS